MVFRGIAQLVEQRSPKPRVEGSSPSTPARKNPLACADIAQQVEHFLGKEEVTGSSPVISSIFFIMHSNVAVFNELVSLDTFGFLR